MALGAGTSRQLVTRYRKLFILSFFDFICLALLRQRDTARLIQKFPRPRPRPPILITLFGLVLPFCIFSILIREKFVIHVIKQTTFHLNAKHISLQVDIAFQERHMAFEETQKSSCRLLGPVLCKIYLSFCTPVQVSNSLS